jgi:hypothetical protein
MTPGYQQQYLAKNPGGYRSRQLVYSSYPRPIERSERAPRAPEKYLR